MNIPFLGRIPTDPHLEESTDTAEPFLEIYPSSPVADAHKHIVHKIMEISTEG